MLISRVVVVKWHHTNREWYENIGYIWTRCNDKFTIKFEELSPSSHAKIDLQCDYCSEPFQMLYSRYVKSKKSELIDKDCCSSCTDLKRNEVLKIRSVKFMYPKIHTEFNKRGLELQTLQTEYNGIGEKLKFICPKHISLGTQEIYWNTFRQSNFSVCETCRPEQIIDYYKNNKRNYKRTCIGKSEFEYDFIYKQFELKNLILIDKEYINNNTPMKFICNIHPEKDIQNVTYSRIQQGGYGCTLCAVESTSSKQRVPIEKVEEVFSSKGFILLDKNYKNSATNLACVCTHHPDQILYISYGNLSVDKHGCKYCWNEKRKGDTSPLWKGGVTPIHNYLRRKITQWKLDTMKNCGYKCVVTGNRFDDIHHIYPFHKILEEVLNETGLKIFEDISKYTSEELLILENKTIELHSKYPLGVCLTSEIHSLFHKEYGYMDNTPEQFEEFKANYADLKVGVAS